VISLLVLSALLALAVVALLLPALPLAARATRAPFRHGPTPTPPGGLRRPGAFPRRRRWARRYAVFPGLGGSPDQSELAQEGGPSIRRMRKLECVPRAGHVRSLEEVDARRRVA